MLNAIGLQNPGTQAVIEEIMPGLDKTETKFIINISHELYIISMVRKF